MEILSHEDHEQNLSHKYMSCQTQMNEKYILDGNTN